MITEFKIFESYEESLDDFKNLEVGDILIAKNDIYINYPNNIEKNYRGTELAFFGDKLFVSKGKTKKVSKIFLGDIFLSGFNHSVGLNKLNKLFFIKDGEQKRGLRKYNL